MSNESELKQNRISTPPYIYAVSTLGVLGTFPTLLLWFTELAYMVGRWYLNFLLISSILIWICLFGIWKMKRWAVFAYTIIIIVTQIVLFKYNVMWSFTSLIIPTIVILTIGYY